jgi:hypothetical protein
MRPSFIDESFSLLFRNDFPTSNALSRLFLLDSLYRLCRGHRTNDNPLTRGTLAAMYCKVVAPSSSFGPIARGTLYFQTSHSFVNNLLCDILVALEPSTAKFPSDSVAFFQGYLREVS